MTSERTQAPRGPGDETTRVRVRVRNEFAVVELSVLHGRTGDRVQIRDVETGTIIELDALELEALSRVAHEDFGPLIVDRNPSEPGEAP